MFLHFVPVDRVEYFSGIFGRERYVFVFLCFQKMSLWTLSEFSPVTGIWIHCLQAYRWVQQFHEGKVAHEGNLF
jgi:hypothetical protein